MDNIIAILGRIKGHHAKRTITQVHAPPGRERQRLETVQHPLGEVEQRRRVGASV
jgi:hypothetical protein